MPFRAVKVIENSDQTRRLEIVTQDDTLFRFTEYSWHTEDGYSYWLPTHFSGIYADAGAAERDAISTFEWLRDLMQS